MVRFYGHSVDCKIIPGTIIHAHKKLCKISNGASFYPNFELLVRARRRVRRRPRDGDGVVQQHGRRQQDGSCWATLKGGPCGCFDCLVGTRESTDFQYSPAEQGSISLPATVPYTAPPPDVLVHTTPPQTFRGRCQWSRLAGAGRGPDAPCAARLAGMGTT